MSDREQIEACYRQMYRGMIEKDRGLLSEVLGDTLDHQRMDAEVHGDTADLVGRSVINAAVFGGGRNTWHLQLRLKLARTGGVWKVTEARAATY